MHITAPLLALLATQSMAAAVAAPNDQHPSRDLNHDRFVGGHIAGHRHLSIIYAKPTPHANIYRHPKPKPKPKAHHTLKPIVIQPVNTHHKKEHHATPTQKGKNPYPYPSPHKEQKKDKKKGENKKKKSKSKGNAQGMIGKKPN